MLSLILSENQTISSSNDTKGFDSFVGLLVEKSHVDAITFNLLNDNYVVPENKRLHIIKAYIIPITAKIY